MWKQAVAAPFKALSCRDLKKSQKILFRKAGL
jgi:hypothetical protein